MPSSNETKYYTTASTSSNKGTKVYYADGSEGIYNGSLFSNSSQPKKTTTIKYRVVQ